MEPVSTRRSRWPPEFSKRRDVNAWNYYFFKDRLRLINEPNSNQQEGAPPGQERGGRDDEELPIDVCFSDSVQTTAALLKIKAFCSNVSWKDVIDAGANSQQPISTLVKNAFVNEEVPIKKHEVDAVLPERKPLTPHGLIRRLGNRSKDSNGWRRRRIYVRDLLRNPEYVLSLFLSAAHVENVELGEAIRRHIDGKPSLRVKISPKGLKKFELSTDLPCFVIDWCLPDDAGPNDVDISSLGIKMDYGRNDPKQKLYLLTGHFTCLMVGADNDSYSAFGFASIVDAEVDLEDPDGDLANQGLVPDHISGDFEDHETYLLDARLYYIRCVSMRLEQLTTLMDVTATRLRAALHDQRNMPVDHSSNHSTQKSCLAWTEVYEGVLVKVCQSLKATMGQLEYFRRKDMQDYFQESSMECYIDSIDHTFETLVGICSDFEHLSEDCKTYAANLKNKSRVRRDDLHEKNGRTNSFTTLFILPCLLTTAVFSMEQTAIPFEAKPKYVLAVFSALLVVMFLMERLSCSEAMNVLATRCSRYLLDKMPQYGKGDPSFADDGDDRLPAPTPSTRSSSALALAAARATTRNLPSTTGCSNDPDIELAQLSRTQPQPQRRDTDETTLFNA